VNISMPPEDNYNYGTITVDGARFSSTQKRKTRPDGNGRLNFNAAEISYVV
jgi:hypothetical protein